MRIPADVCITNRPTEMLTRQLDALRAAARYRNAEIGRRHHVHAELFRASTVAYVWAIRNELKKRKKNEH